MDSRRSPERKAKPVATSTLLAGLIVLLGPTPASAIDITSCPVVINQPGDYHLRQHIACSPASPNAAVTITASNVTLHLNGFTISGGGTGFAGILVGALSAGPIVASDIVVQGGTVRNFQFNVILSRGTDSKVVNVDASNTMPTAAGNAITVLRAHNNRIVNCSASNSSFNGINVLSSNDNSLIANHANGNAQVGIAIQRAAGDVASMNNIVRANTAVNNAFLGIRIFEGGTDNVVQANYAAGNPSFDLQDDNATCDANIWKANRFGTASQPCID
jgi:parallel beta-helix repeat protein